MPLLPLDSLIHWNAPSPEAIRQKLRAVVCDPAINEALYVASPQLHGSLPAWLEAPQSEQGQRVESALVRYLFRMAGRATPFGLFSSVSFAAVGATQSLHFERKFWRLTRLDMDYLWKLSSAIGSDPQWRGKLRYQTNTSLYRVGDRFRFVQTVMRDELRLSQLAAVEVDDDLEKTLNFARAPITLEGLFDALWPGADSAAKGNTLPWLDSLIDAQLLVPHIQPTATGSDAALELAEQLAAVDHPAAPLLRKLSEGAAAIDARALGNSPALYEALEQSATVGALKPSRGQFLHVDLARSADGVVLSERMVSQAVFVCELLVRLSPRRRALEGFKSAFNARYEAAEVPLLEALDEESGIGFPDAPQSGATPSRLARLMRGELPDTSPVARDTPFERYLRFRVGEALQRGDRAIVLDRAALAKLAAQSPAVHLPRGASLRLIVLAPEDGKPRAVLGGFREHNASAWFGRFCHLDPRLSDWVKGYAQQDAAAHPEAIVAEVAHIPPDRVGNIMHRPVLGTHEIVYLSRSSARAENQIPMDDLRVSVRGDRVVLRSAALGREVLPRLTHMHNTSSPDNLAAYRFLSSVERQAELPGVFDWGALRSTPVLPRLVLDGLILAPARWTVDEPRLKPLRDLSPSARFTSVQTLRAQLGWPRFIALSEFDNLLPTDLDNPLSVEATFSTAVRRPVAVFEELLPVPGQSGVTDSNGGYTNEFVVPLGSTASAPRRPLLAREKVPPAERTFPPGSGWLYTQWYGGVTDADRVLVEHLGPLVAQLRADGLISGWFFLRYADPDTHLRVRFSGDPQVLLKEVLPRVCAVYQRASEQRLVRRFRIDTYEREIERYGGPSGMALAEKFFCADSDLVVGVVSTTEQDGDARWLAAWVALSTMLQSLALPHEEQLKLWTAARDGFREELGIKSAGLDRISAEHRMLRKKLEAATGGAQLPPELENSRPHFVAWRERCVPLWKGLTALQLDGRLGGVLGSWVHMHVNRMLRSEQRANEAALLDFWVRRLITLRARPAP